MKKKALITGITGQDGSYLSELLLEKGYEVHGVVRRSALEDQKYKLSRINHIKDNLFLHPGDIQNYSRMIDIVDNIRPDELYHLAAQSFVQESFEDSFSTIKTNIEGTHNVLSALKKRSPNGRFYFAGSSEMFGNASVAPQSENTRFNPRSPYGISKLTGFELAKNYRESYNMFTSTGILFNHESPRRGSEFVTRKITKKIGEIKRKEDNILILGNLDAKRDWGFAGDYVNAMWQMLQQKEPKDYVVSTGENHSIREFLDKALNMANLDCEFFDLHGLKEEEADKYINNLRKKKQTCAVVQHPKYYRPAEVHQLLGDSTLAQRDLNWKPNIDFDGLVKMMVDSDLQK